MDTIEQIKIRKDLIHPLPKQEQFLDAMYDKEYILYGGAAGPGKSYILRWSLIELLLYWFTQGHTGVHVGLFCEDYPALKGRQISKMKREFPLWLGELKNTQNEGLGFFLRPDYGSGVISLNNL